MVYMNDHACHWELIIIASYTFATDEQKVLWKAELAAGCLGIIVCDVPDIQPVPGLADDGCDVESREKHHKWSLGVLTLFQLQQ